MTPKEKLVKQYMWWRLGVSVILSASMLSSLVLLFACIPLMVKGYYFIALVFYGVGAAASMLLGVLVMFRYWLKKAENGKGNEYQVERRRARRLSMISLQEELAEMKGQAVYWNPVVWPFRAMYYIGRFVHWLFRRKQTALI